MAKKIAVTNLNARTIDILNVIRANASYEYQKDVPKIEKENDIPTIGEYICGTPAHANEFLNALINRIALVRVKSAVFNNPYSHLKKGYLEFGESVEDIFVGIINAVKYTPEKAPEREFKRTVPDVHSVFHMTNWRVMYPITIEKQTLRRAFLSADGVTDLIEKIIAQVYTSAEYDEYLLFKYLLIKAISHGKLKPVSVDFSNVKNGAKAFRGKSNLLPIDMSGTYNEAGVKNNTPTERQAIFMDAQFNADFDVDVLASAFNMDKADFIGKLHLIDDWSSFDNERFDTIRAESNDIEEVTTEELTLMKDVKAVLIDEEWFQIYDNLMEFDETKVGSGLYWNYWLHIWKTISYSPFANAIVFVNDTAKITLPDSLTVEVTGKEISETVTILTLGVDTESASLEPNIANFVQTESLINNGIAVQKYGVIIIPADKVATEINVVANIGSTVYTATDTINASNNVGDTITLTQG